MRGTVMFGAKPVELLADGATPFHFRRVMHLDLFVFFAKCNEGGAGDAATTEMLTRLGYVMAMQADGKIKEASEENMLDWLAEFNPADISGAFQGIMELYNQQTTTMSAAKKNDVEQTEK